MYRNRFRKYRNRFRFYFVKFHHICKSRRGFEALYYMYRKKAKFNTNLILIMMSRNEPILNLKSIERK